METVETAIQPFSQDIHPGLTAMPCCLAFRLPISINQTVNKGEGRGRERGGAYAEGCAEREGPADRVVTPHDNFKICC